MARLTTIAGVPLFTTVQEALSWAAANNCSGYHTHTHQGQLGYMGCVNHSQASSMPLDSSASATSSSSSSSSSSSAGGGGGGY